MVSPRHQARIVALQGLYQLDIQRAGNDVAVAEMLAPLLSEAELSGEPAEYATALTQGTWLKRDTYDQMITEVSRHWEVGRMAVVDRNILRLALHELVDRPDVPPRVAIDEAIELGREYGAAETPTFVNGVLDAIWKQHPACRLARGEDDKGGKGQASA